MSATRPREMDLYGFGSNAFGQIQPLLASENDNSDKRILASPIEIATFDASERGKILVSLSWSNLILANGQGTLLYGFHDNSTTNMSMRTGPVKAVCAASQQNFVVTESGRCLSLRHDDAGDEPKIVKVANSSNAADNQNEVLSKVASGDLHTVAVTDDGETLYLDQDQRDPIFKPMALHIKVKAVSCGKEHVLLLSRIGVVLSYGLGSRGQLGHGTTENQKEPRIIEGLEGVTMAHVSAGGWHSVALSDIGDLYVWGWNERGQLGLPCKELTNNRAASKGRSSHVTVQQHEVCHRGGDHVLQVQTYLCPDNQATGLEEISQDRDSDCGPYCANERTSGDSAGQTSSHTADACDGGTMVTQLALGDTAQQNVQPVERETESEVNKRDPLCDRSVEGDSELPQTVNFQMVPCIVDVDSERECFVSGASCGSRHTAAITDEGVLYSWGWNAYGQLGHGDTQCRDQPTVVQYFVRNELTVNSVECGDWNTSVIAAKRYNLPGV